MKRLGALIGLCWQMTCGLFDNCRQLSGRGEQRPLSLPRALSRVGTSRATAGVGEGPTKFATAQYTEKASVLPAAALARRESENTSALLHDIN